MKLAVLLPVKNGAKTICEAINSVDNQSFFHDQKHQYEIYLVDNNSTDNLIEVVQSLNTKIPINYLRCYEPGVAPALNSGLFKIMSRPDIDYIARIDADDVWMPNKIELQMEAIFSMSIDICGTCMTFVYNGNREVRNYPSDDHDIKNWLIRGGNPMAHPSIIYHKGIFLYCGGYDENYKHAEDLDLWTRCYSRFKFHNVQQPLVDYHFDPTIDRSVSDRNAQKIFSKLRDLHG
jgi:glycosyltransferase involved in cell wall biosynthesis